MSDFYNNVYQYVKRVPSGKVVTYGDVARAVGSPRASRQVGQALHRNPAFGVVPCHRVVFADGSLASEFAFGGAGIQRQMLENEGVLFTSDGKVDMPQCRWIEEE